MAKQTGKKISVFADKLRGMQDTVAQAMADYKPGGVRVPEGIYTAKESAELKEAKKTGNLMIARQFTVNDGEFKGLNIWDNLVIQNNPTGIQIARRWVEKHGFAFPEEDFAEIETIINEINDLGATVKVKLKFSPSQDPDRPYSNLDVLEVLDDPRDAGDPARPDNALMTDAGDALQPSDDDLIAFCASQGVEGAEDGTPRDEILEAMAGYNYDRATLTAEEVEMLEAVGLGDKIQAEAEPEPPKPAARLPQAAQARTATAKATARTTATHFGKAGKARR